MKIIAGAVVIAALTLCGPALSQERPTIVVTGNGEASAPPDRFRIGAGVEGRGDTQAEALRALSMAQARIMDALPRLDGLTHAVLTTGNIGIHPITDQDCERRAGRNEACPALGYRAGAGIKFEGAPANRAGNAISLASELGASQAALDEYALGDQAALREQANRAAFLDARRQAEMLAQASGSRLVRIVRIQDPSARYDDATNTEVDEIVVTGSRIRQAVSIAAAPEPVTANARITVVFEIE